MDNEIRQTVYIAIGAILLGAVLGLMVQMRYVANGMTDIRVNELTGISNIRQYREFNKYSHKTVSGSDVIECITNNYDNNIGVVANNRVYEYINPDFKEYTLKMYLDENTKSKFDINNLMREFPSDYLYRSYLVYNSEDPKTKYDLIAGGITNILDNTMALSDIEKIYDTEESKLRVLQNSEVTGILFIRIK